MTPDSRRQSVKAALIWELCWIPVEMVCVGIGLWMSLMLQWVTVGSLCLVAFLMVDSIGRFQHYSKVAPRIHGKELAS